MMLHRPQRLSHKSQFNWKAQWLVFLGNLTQSRMTQEEWLNSRLSRSGWPVDLPVGDCLYYVNLCGTGQFTVESTVP